MEVLPPDPGDLAVPARADRVALPRYGRASLAEVVPAITARLVPDGGDAPAPLPDLPPIGGRVVLLVVDGLGSRQLARVPGLAPTIRGAPGPDVDAVFPSTTVASLGSIGTGVPPSRHGLVGYSFRVPGETHPLQALTWSVGLRGGGWDARRAFVPEAVQPVTTALEAAYAAGVDTTVVLHPDFPDSGLSRAVLRGGQRVTARGLGATLDRALSAVAEADGPALAYAHHPLVDWAGHGHGPCTPEWCDAVADVDRALAGLDLPDGTTIVLTADHGMVDTTGEDVELAGDDRLADGVAAVFGEPRVRQVALADGADVEEVAANWRAVLGDRALVATRAQALPWFGPDPRDGVVDRIGDLVVLARRGRLVHERVDPHGGRHVGQHGGPTPAERLVPLRVLGRP